MNETVGSTKNLMNTGVKKVGSAVITQAVILGLSFMTGFILPKYMGPDKFGYWQIYIFYLSFINLFGLGFNDGFALFYGGYKYDDLPYKRIRSGVRFFYLYLLVITLLLFAAAMLINDGPKRQIFIMLTVNVPLVCLQCFILTVFLSVNKTSIYNGLNLLAKVLATSLFTVLLFVGITSADYMMGAETIARAAVTIICLFLGRRFLFSRDVDIRLGRKEFYEKTKYGANIMLGIIASTLIPVAGRLVVEYTHPIAEYGLYSFATSLLTIIITFTNTAGVVIFPVLKTLPEKHLPQYYTKLSYLCSNLIYVAFFAYIPFVLLIQSFMPDYTPVFSYMHILFAMCLPLGKLYLLLIPYFKALRFERSFLVCNILGVIAMLSATCAAQWIFRSVSSIAVATTFVLIVWYFLAESYLLNKMNVKRDRKVLLQDILVIAVFILGAGLESIWWFMAVYGIPLFISLLLSRKSLLLTVESLRSENLQ